ncbi:class II glutamine amidotransferase [Roseateles sp. BYS180W]|uniref:Class II glutamine amidotransferase n=1 Tax=Roseateles rivi TaxID=3299028 RepID=A0ABW7FTF6_9BURK
MPSVAVIATQPLTRDQPWVAFAPGELKVFVGGSRRPPVPQANF